MQNLVIVGLQWGDEGKGKLVDFISEGFDIVVRFQGGSNAGHTVIIGDQTHKLRLMPTGAVRGKKVVIGNGVVLDPQVLLDEISRLSESGIPVDMLISDRAHVITPFHIQLDGLQEAVKGDKKVGTTKRGIGPTYSDKMQRVGVRVCDIIGSTSQWQQMEESAELRIHKLYSTVFETEPSTAHNTYKEMFERLAQYVGDSGEYLDSSIMTGKKVLFEGAQGTLLDVDHGTYPYVTSSNCASAAAATGTGISFTKIDTVLGITKAYTTRVGEGPFPTELFDEVGATIRDQGQEFGTVTGRPRRCGWLDLIALKYAVRVNGSEHLAITKLDVLNGIKTLKLCVAYNQNGTEMTSFPASAETLQAVTPVYEELEGWETIVGTEYDDLPGTLREYVARIERFAHTKAAILSIGPDRNETIPVPGNPFIDA